MVHKQKGQGIWLNGLQPKDRDDIYMSNDTCILIQTTIGNITQYDVCTAAPHDILLIVAKEEIYKFLQFWVRQYTV